jgi:hypothetical protein
VDSEATANGNNGSGSRVCAPLGLGEIVYLIDLIRWEEDEIYACNRSKSHHWFCNVHFLVILGARQPMMRFTPITSVYITNKQF